MKTERISQAAFFKRFKPVSVKWCIFKWTPLHDMAAIIPILQSLDAKLVIEIGTGWGHMAACFSKCTPDNCKIVTIGITSDMNWSGMPDQKTQAPDREGPRKIGQHINHYKLGHKVELVIADSRELDFAPYKGADFVFIDGGHDEATVLSDLLNAYQIVREGGYVVLHDFMKPSCQIDAAVAKFPAEETVYGVSNTIVGYFQKATHGKDRSTDPDA